MDPIIWPIRTLVPANVKLSLQNTSRGGGPGITGNEQVVVSPAGRWALTFGGVVIRTKDQVRAWRAIEAQADGRANALLVPIYDRSRSPVLSQIETGIDFSGASFLPNTASTTLTADAPVNATSLSVTWTTLTPMPGQHFSIGTALYRIATVANAGARAATLTVRPWLRAAAGQGSALNFDQPICLVRLAKDDGLDLDLQGWRFASPSVDFVEAV